jgi:hypothetical protein
MGPDEQQGCRLLIAANVLLTRSHVVSRWNALRTATASSRQSTHFAILGEGSAATCLCVPVVPDQARPRVRHPPRRSGYVWPLR